jgi:putative membrane protein
LLGGEHVARDLQQGVGGSAESARPMLTLSLRGTRSVLRDGSWWPRRHPVRRHVHEALSAGAADWSHALRLRDDADHGDHGVDDDQRLQAESAHTGCIEPEEQRMKRVAITAAVIGCMGPAAAATEGLPMWWWGGLGHMGGWGGGWPLLGVVHMLLWSVLIVLGIAVLARWLLGGGLRRHGDSDTALAILRERYARGEINREEFEQRKGDLGG